MSAEPVWEGSVVIAVGPEGQDCWIDFGWAVLAEEVIQCGFSPGDYLSRLPNVAGVYTTRICLAADEDGDLRLVSQDVSWRSLWLRGGAL